MSSLLQNERMQRQLDAQRKTISLLRAQLKEMAEKAESEARTCSHAERQIARQVQRLDYLARTSVLEHNGETYSGDALLRLLQKGVF